MKTGFVLILCLLTATLPGHTLHLSLCACNGIVTGDTCPCEDSPRETCCSASDAPAPCCDPTDSDADGCGDGCCHAFGVEDVSLPVLARPDLGIDDVGVEYPFVEMPPRIELARANGPSLARATGPPLGHRLRRALGERAATVLLI